MAETDAMNLPVVNIDSLQSLIGHYLFVIIEEDGEMRKKILGPVQYFNINEGDGIVYIKQKHAMVESLYYEKETGNIPGILYESPYLWQVQLFEMYMKH